MTRPAVVLVCDGPVPHAYMNYRGDPILAQLVRSTNYEIHVVAPRATEIGGTTLPSGSRVAFHSIGRYRCISGLGGMLMRLWQMTRAYIAVRRVCRRTNVSLIRTVSTLPTVVACAAAARMTPRPRIVANLSDFYDDLYSGSRLPLRRLATTVLRRLDAVCARADVVIVDTPRQRDAWVARGIDARTCVVIPHGLPRSGHRAALANGVDDPELRQLLGWVRGPLGIYVGDIGAMDGIDLLLGAQRMVREMGIPLQLCIVGQGPRSYLDTVRRMATALGVADAVRWIARIPNAALPELFAAGDLCYAPFRLWRTSSTSIPNKGLEYLTTSLPIIAPSGCAFMNAAGPTLDSFTAGDTRSLAVTTVRVLQRSPRLAASQQSARLKLRELLDWDRITEHEIDVLQRVLGTPAQVGLYDYETSLEATGVLT